MVEKTPDISSTPPPTPPETPKETEKNQTSGSINSSHSPNPFPQMKFGPDSGITESEFKKKFYEQLEKQICAVIQKNTEKMKQALQELRKQSEGQED